MKTSQSLTAILACNDLDASEAFYRRLGFERTDDDRSTDEEPDSYRILHDGHGGTLHLTLAAPGWLVSGKNPFGLYYTREEVDRLAEVFRAEIIEPNAPEDKPWGMYEFAVSDPDSTLVRIGWPTRLRAPAQQA